MGEITLREALEEYKSVYMAYRNFAERTRVEYQNDLEGFIEFSERSGVSTVRGLRLPIIHRYLAQLEHQGYSSLTRKRKTVTVRSFLSFLYQDGYLDSNIAKKVILPFTENPLPKILTLDECNKLRKACIDNPRDRAMVELFLATGIKLSELIRLTINDIAIMRNGKKYYGTVRILHLRGKKDRVLPINSKTIFAVKDYFEIRQKSNNITLFLNRFGTPMGERGVQKAIKEYLKKAGIRNASVHTLRHTYGFQSAARGICIRKIQEFMGLHDKRSALIYHS